MLGFWVADLGITLRFIDMPCKVEYDDPAIGDKKSKGQLASKAPFYTDHDLPIRSKQSPPN